MTKNGNYDFIICDLNMPVMDGYECAFKIKEFYKNSNQIFEVSNDDKTELLCPYLVACSALINQDV